MLSRRGFVGFASCAICAVTGFEAVEVSAQQASSGGPTRKLLSQVDGPVPGYMTMVFEATIPPGSKLPRHTHPGVESTYLLAGSLQMPVDGQLTRDLTAGDAFQVPATTPHGGGVATTEQTRLLITYIVEKDKPLTSPA